MITSDISPKVRNITGVRRYRRAICIQTVFRAESRHTYQQNP
jgi:hypothetical protein